MKKTILNYVGCLILKIRYILFLKKLARLFYLLIAFMAAVVANAQVVTDPSVSNPNYDIEKQNNVEVFGGEEVSGGSFNTMSALSAFSTLNAQSSTCFIPLDNTYTAIPVNDDGSFGPINLPFVYSLYGSNFTQVWINTNGNLTFTGALSAYSSSGFPYHIPMVAPFWADVDTRVGGRIYYKLTSESLIVTFHEVNYYGGGNDNKRNTFQVVLTNGLSTSIGIGNNTAFYYGDMQWTTGTASGGSGGFGGTPATVGINRGNGIDYVQIGRFNTNTSNYDGPGGAFDGVNYLDFKCFNFAVGNSDNIPPSSSNMPANNTITLNVGESITFSPEFIGPEVNQTVVTTVSTSMCGVSYTITNGIVSTANISITGSACNVGANTIIIEATDNGVPARTTTEVIAVNVINLCNVTALSKDITVQLDENGNAQISAEDVNDNSEATCGIASFSINQSTFTCANIGENTVVLTVTDESGNEAATTAIVTVVDNVAPDAVCSNIEVFLNEAGVASITADDVDGGSSDACGIASVEISATEFTLSNVGENTVTLSVSDINGNTSSCEAVVVVKKRPSVLTYDQSFYIQYSDSVVFFAILTDFLTGNGIEGKTIDFVLGNQTASAVTNGNGIASASILVTQAPGSYSIESSFAGDEIYLSSNDNHLFSINQEDAVATYTGAMFASTSGTNSSSATVTLSATIQDITAVPGDPSYDIHDGDILKASVSFRIIETGEVIPANLGYVNAADKKTAVATATWNTSIGNSDSEQFTVEIVVGGHYTRSLSSDDYVVVTISKPLSDFVTGGGYIVLANSEGEKAGDAGSKNNFGFNLKYNKNGKNLQGKVNVIVRRTEADGIQHIYQIKSNKTNSLSVQSQGKAVFNMQASIQDITDPDNPVSLEGNASLQIEITDNGEPGKADMIGISLLSRNGGLWYSSNWNGVKTVETTLSGGNLVVRGAAVNASNAGVDNYDNSFASGSSSSSFENFRAYPVPLENGELWLEFNYVLQDENVTATISDMKGKKLAEVSFKVTEPSFRYRWNLNSAKWPSGFYVLVVQGKTILYQEKLIK